MNITQIYRSGRVMRWHSNPDMAWARQSLAHHQWGVAVIILAEHPDPSRELIKAALLHDVGELFVGDLPQPFKAAHYEAVRLHREAEDAFLRAMGAWVDLTPQETAWLHWADRKEAYDWMLANNPGLADGKDWRESAKWIMGNKPS